MESMFDDMPLLCTFHTFKDTHIVVKMDVK